MRILNKEIETPPGTNRVDLMHAGMNSMGRKEAAVFVWDNTAWRIMATLYTRLNEVQMAMLCETVLRDAPEDARHAFVLETTRDNENAAFVAYTTWQQDKVEFGAGDPDGNDPDDPTIETVTPGQPQERSKDGRFQSPEEGQA